MSAQTEKYVDLGNTIFFSCSDTVNEGDFGMCQCVIRGSLESVSNGMIHAMELNDDLAKLIIVLAGTYIKNREERKKKK